MLNAKSRTWVEIDLQKLKHNTKIVNERIGNTKIMAVVKADMYGHGDTVIANTLQNEMNIDYFCVSSVDEAISLRENGIRAQILILGYTPTEHFHYLHELSITQTIFSLEYAEKLNDYAKKQQTRITCHIKVDTGMSRLGIPCTMGNYCIDEVKLCYNLPQIHIEGIYSHFSVADSIQKQDDLAYTKQQIALYDQVLTDLKESKIEFGLTHIHNSYGCLNYFDVEYDYARPGLILVGCSSDATIPIQKEIDLQPILEWKANVSLVKKVKANTPVSYGRNFITKEDSRLATLSVGYADGLSRHASHQGMQVLLHGVRCEIVGNICMDQCIVDVSHIPQVQEGDVATIIGQDGNEILTIDDLSHCANTINNESFCLLSKRVPRFYKR